MAPTSVRYQEASGVAKILASRGVTVIIRASIWRLLQMTRVQKKASPTLSPRQNHSQRRSVGRTVDRNIPPPLIDLNQRRSGKMSYNEVHKSQKKLSADSEALQAAWIHPAHEQHLNQSSLSLPKSPHNMQTSFELEACLKDPYSINDIFGSLSSNSSS
ncbi:hypothetical protein J6590_028485 [Homalodisca vitripennis]|nr:hypothetical protein J6590_028485 [Homalodisca vitripennis]